MMNTIIAKSIT